jgi:hypothetical protein
MLTPTLFKTIALRPPKAPNLPIAPVSYSQQYQDQLLNVLRLYFNELDNFSLSIKTPTYGVTSERPTEGLAIGLFYFDTTLGIPIWWDGSNWVDATGATV